MGLASTHKFVGDSKWMRSFTEIGEDTLISAADDNSMRFWSLAESRCVQTVSCHSSYVRDVAVLNAAVVLTASLDRTAKVVRVKDGHVLASCTFAHPLWSCAALNATTAVVGDEKGNIFKLKWDSYDLTVLNQVDGAHKDEITEIFTYGDTFTTCSVDRTVQLRENMSLALLHTFRGHRDSVYSVTYDDMYLCTSSRDNTIRVYDARNFEYINTIKTHTNTVNCVRIVHGTNILVSGGWDKLIALHALPTGDCINKYNIGMYITSITLLTSGLVAVGGSRPCAVHVLKIPELSSPSPSPEPEPKLESEPKISKATSVNGSEEIRPAVEEQSNPPPKNQDAIAREEFKKMAGKGNTLLVVDDATAALNHVLGAMGVQKRIDVEEFEDIFMEISEDVKVSEEKFVEVFLQVVEKSEQHLEQQYGTMFADNVKDREAVRVPFAVRILKHGCKQLKERNGSGDKAVVEEEKAKSLMAKFARASDGKINREAFVNAALFIVHDIQRQPSKMVAAVKEVTNSNSRKS